MNLLIKLIIRFHILVFIITWLYVLMYPIIERIFNLNSGYKLRLRDLIKIFFVSLIPLLNVFALYSAIKEDIDLYQKSNK